jgi:hypothetical protein
VGGWVASSNEGARVVSSGEKVQEQNR